MPTLETSDGKPVDVTPADAEAVNAQFRAAMEDDGDAEKAPPKRQPKPAQDASDAAKPRRGRPPKSEQARATDKPAGPVKDDYTEDAQNLVGSIWSVTACVSVTQPYALVVESNADGLVKALAEGAKHNTMIRGWVSAGESSWMLGLASVGLNMGMQAYQLMKDPQLREQAAETTRAHLKEAMGAKGLQVDEPAEDLVAA